MSQGPEVRPTEPTNEQLAQGQLPSMPARVPARPYLLPQTRPPAPPRPTISGCQLAMIIVAIILLLPLLFFFLSVL